MDELPMDRSNEISDSFSDSTIVDSEDEIDRSSDNEMMDTQDDSNAMASAIEMPDHSSARENMLLRNSSETLSLENQVTDNENVLNKVPQPIHVDPVRQGLVDRGIRYFNLNPKKGLKFLQHRGVVSFAPGNTSFNAKSIASFLFGTRGLNKEQIGVCLGEDDEQSVAVLREYVHMFDFSEFGATVKGIEDGLRKLLAYFKPPGEAQKIDRILIAFADKFSEDNIEGSVGNHVKADATYMVAFITILLNVDLHNRNNPRRMTRKDFLRNCIGISEVKDVSTSELKALYDRIQKNEIQYVTDREDLSGNLFTNPDKCGWLLKKGPHSWSRWKYRWFILSANTLYYFKHSDDIDFIGFIPLENVKIHTAKKYANGKLTTQSNPIFHTKGRVNSCYSDSTTGTDSKISTDVDDVSSAKSHPDLSHHLIDTIHHTPNEIVDTTTPKHVKEEDVKFSSNGSAIENVMHEESMSLPNDAVEKHDSDDSLIYSSSSVLNHISEEGIVDHFVPEPQIAEPLDTLGKNTETSSETSTETKSNDKEEAKGLTLEIPTHVVFSTDSHKGATSTRSMSALPESKVVAAKHDVKAPITPAGTKSELMSPVSPYGQIDRKGSRIERRFSKTYNFNVFKHLHHTLRTAHVPPEDTEVDPNVPGCYPKFPKVSSRFWFELKPWDRRLKVKSARMNRQGQLVLGQHHTIKLRTDSRKSLEDWVQVLNKKGMLQSQTVEQIKSESGVQSPYKTRYSISGVPLSMKKQYDHIARVRRHSFGCDRRKPTSQRTLLTEQEIHEKVLSQNSPIIAQASKEKSLSMT